MNQKWSTEKILGVIFGVIGALAVLAMAVLVSFYEFFGYPDRMGESLKERLFGVESGTETEIEPEETVEPEKDTEPNFSEEILPEQEEREYYEFHDEIRNDLSYQVSFLTDEYKSSANVSSKMRYPVIEGESVPNLEGINDAIQTELQVVRQYMDELAQLLPAESELEYEGELYVTYMDEQLFSMIYSETGYIDGEQLESYLVAVNIDMETGIVLSNTQLLNIDDAFSIEFRKRCAEQNGSISTLDALSDQEITGYLKDDKYLVIFYTPSGMEVGFNFPGGWVTVTYPDYLSFRNQI